MWSLFRSRYFLLALLFPKRTKRPHHSHVINIISLEYYAYKIRYAPLTCLMCNKGKRQIFTGLDDAQYWIFRSSIPLIMLCMAMKMFWYTSLMKPRLSSSEYPAPWIIRICLINVDFPDSPVPVHK